MTLSIASLEAAAAETSQPFIDSTYYGEAEKWTALWWDDRLPFRAMFDRMALDFTIELAAGYGRHAEYSAPLAKQLLLMDVIERNLKICRVRLGERFPNVRYAVNNGFNYEPLGSGQASAIYCYDAMVHFSGDLVESYLADTARVLRPGGRALFHHSNYDGPQLEHFGQHPHARQRMTQQRFLALAGQAKLQIVESKIIPWAGIPDLDCVTMVEKPEDIF